jgi:altronate hydrolase
MNVIRIHEGDTVGVAIQSLKRGGRIHVPGLSLKLRQDVPQGHKVALENIPADSPVRKYGHIIGHATKPIAAGSWIHSHNLGTNLAGKSHYVYKPVKANLPEPRVQASTFKGFKRKSGKTGTRNEIWIISTVGCINGFVEKLAALASAKFRLRNCDGIFAITHPYGCSQLGGDLEYTQRILAGLARHPNAGGILIVGLGCENNQLNCQLSHLGTGASARLKFFNLQDVGDEMSAGLKAVGSLVAAAEKDHRVDCPVSDLVIGLKCGGSDAFSGITANPLVGRIADRLVNQSGTVMLSEVPEMFGAEQLLMDRAASPKVFKAIVELIRNFKAYFIAHGQPVYENPSPGNKAGGITTLEEKSLGAIQKGGTAVVTQVLAYGEPVTRKGLVLVNAPGNDGVASTAMIASGATVLLFTTGRGTPMGFPVPTIKISSTTGLCSRKPGWTDFNAGKRLAGTSWEALTDDLFELVLGVASGRVRTRNEINGYRDIAIWKTGVTL